MKTAYELLMSAPDSQVIRCQIVLRAITEGDWAEAENKLRNAAREEGRSDWAFDALELADHCNEKAHAARIRATDEAAAYHALSVRDNAIDRKWAAKLSAA